MFYWKGVVAVARVLLVIAKGLQCGCFGTLPGHCYVLAKVFWLVSVHCNAFTVAFVQSEIQCAQMWLLQSSMVIWKCLMHHSSISKLSKLYYYVHLFSTTWNLSETNNWFKSLVYNPQTIHLFSFLELSWSLHFRYSWFKTHVRSLV